MLLTLLCCSGTEPKIKYYSELRGDDEVQAKQDLVKVVDSIGIDLMQYEKNGLEKKKDDE
jgi:phosphoglucomutase